MIVGCGFYRCGRGEIAGVLGVYLSVPVMAAIRIIWKSARRYSESSQISYPTAA